MHRLCLFTLLALMSCRQNEAKFTFQYSAASAYDEKTRSLAVEWLEKIPIAEDFQLAADDQGMPSKVLEHLRVAPLNFVSDSEKSLCNNPGIVGFTLENYEDRGIFICEKAHLYSQAFLAQMLIHEGIHLTGIKDECETTRLELNLVRASGVLPFVNSYFTDCGLQYPFD
jgi:hypothetical protein